MRSILFVLPALGIGGAEKSIIELFKVIDYSRYEVDLLLLVNEGQLIFQVPQEVNIIKPSGIVSKFNQGISKAIKQLVGDHEYGLAIKRLSMTVSHKMRSKNYKPYVEWMSIKNEVETLERRYDIAIAYLQGLAEYYVADKVKADQKIFWMHTSFKAHNDADDIERSYINAFDKVVCVSEAARRDFIELFPDKMQKTEVFHNIVDVEEVTKKAELETPLPDDGKFKIVSVGRLHYAKGYDISIQAFAQFRKKYPNTAFYIVGTGPEKDALQKLIQQLQLEEDCHLVGSTLNPYPYMKQADVVLQASRYEGYCIVLAEAKALNKPIITTDFFGAREQIIDGQTGIIVKDTTSSSIYDALMRVYSDTELRNFIVENLITKELGHNDSFDLLVE